MRGAREFSFDSGPKSKSNNSKKMSVTFLLTGRETVSIAISFNLFFNELKSLIKQRYEARWNKESKLWQIKLSEYKGCLQQVRRLMQSDANKCPQAAVNRIPEFVFRAQKEMDLRLQIRNGAYSVVREVQYSELQLAIQPRVLPFYDRLYDFQKESLQFGIRHHGRLLLADEMGVGKTIQSLAIVSVYRHEWPFLVICPSSLRLNWQQEMLNWLGDYLKKSDIQVYSKGGSIIRESVRALIVSYDLAWKMRDQLQQFRVVIADEAHYLKNAGNKRSDTLMPYLSARKRVVLLTGTPALAKPREIYNLLSIVRPDVYTHFKQFGYRYCEPTVNPWSRAMEFNGCANARQLHYLIANRAMIRRLKREVLSMLPEKQRQRVVVETDRAIIKEIKGLVGKLSGGSEAGLESLMVQALNGGGEAEGGELRQAISLAYKLTGEAKLHAVRDYVLELLQNDVKMLIFAHHIVVLDGLEAALKERKVRYMRIDGSVSKQARHESVGLFQQQESMKVALLSITAAGVGLTLTAASTVVFAQLHWTPGTMIQAEDRAHRIGQKSSVNCHYLIGEGSLDDMLYRQLERKVCNVASFVEGRDERLEIEKMSKGEKGKVAKVDKESRDSILFKFQSVRPIVDKYFLYNQSQDTDISAVGSKGHNPAENRKDTEGQDRQEHQDSDIEQSEKSETKKRRKGNSVPVEIEQQSIMQIETGKKQQKKQQRVIDQSQSQSCQDDRRRSSQICDFIVENANELLVYSQQGTQQQQQTQSIGQ